MHPSCCKFILSVLGHYEIHGKRVLEIGSQNVNGSPRDWLSQYEPMEWHGIDQAEQDEYVDEVCDGSKIGHHHDSSWDVVISTEMLEHCKDWRGAIEGMKRALKVGGILIVTARGPGKEYHGYPSDYWRFTLQDFEAIFADYEVLKLENDTGEPGVLFCGRKLKDEQVALESIKPEAAPKPVGVQHKTQLVICTPIPVVDGPKGPRLAMITSEWHRARMELQVPFGYNAMELRCDGFEVGDARTRAVEKAREVGAEFIFFIDYDTLLPVNAFKQLMYRATATHTEFDCFSGCYTVKEIPSIPIIYKRWAEGPYWDWTVGEVIEDVVGIPMGCCLLRLSAFDRLTNTPEKPWFKTVDLSKGNPLDPSMDSMNIKGAITEDLWFSKRAKEEAGMRMLVDTAVQCGHIRHDTGEIFCLPEDCPPVKRAGIKLNN